ncbi:MAG: hypothetical protein WD207_09085 [Xanthobacteraceae bacterium]
MTKKKSKWIATLNLRITPEIKAVACRLARGGRRSVTTLIEFLIMEEAKKMSAKPPARTKAKR